MSALVLFAGQVLILTLKQDDADFGANMNIQIADTIAPQKLRAPGAEYIHTLGRAGGIDLRAGIFTINRMRAL